jgi:hypothetical protein
VADTGRLDLPDLKVVHVRGFKVSPDNPVTVLRDLIREEFHFDTSSIWNLSGRANTQIVELVVVKAQVPALLAAFVNNKLGLQISTGYDPRRPDKVETEAVALSNFKTRVDREIARINRALVNNHYVATVSKLRHVVKFLEAFRDGHSNEPVVQPPPLPYYMTAFFDVSALSTTLADNVDRDMSC